MVEGVPSKAFLFLVFEETWHVAKRALRNCGLRTCVRRVSIVQKHHVDFVNNFQTRPAAGMHASWARYLVCELLRRLWLHLKYRRTHGSLSLRKFRKPKLNSNTFPNKVYQPRDLKIITNN